MKTSKFSRLSKLVICLSLIISLFAGAISAFAATDTSVSRAVSTRTKVVPYKNPTGSTVVGLSGPLGVRLNITTSFTGVNFQLATYLVNNITADISLYEWKGSYRESLEGPAVFTDNITLVDNARQGVIFDREIPAGDYIFVFHNYTGAVAAYSYTAADGFDGYIYQNGYPITQLSTYPYIEVLFPKKSDSYFGVCSKPSDIIDGNHTPPAEYVIPEDSLIYTHPVMPDTWVFTDGLGRTSLTNAEVGDVKDRTLAMFYWSWHIDSNSNGNAVNLQELSEKYPNAMRDYNNSLWNSYTDSRFLWNESIYGFYKSNDKWVLRKQAELLANAGVDVIFTDNTNGQFTWANAYNPLMEAWDDAMTDGVLTPKVSFMLPFGSKTDTNAQVRSIYLDIYRAGRYQNLWFYWEGKPMLMGMADSFNPSSSLEDKEIANFFTFRAGQPGYVVSGTANSSWGWLSMYPQALYYKNNTDRNNGVVEQMAVGVAMNHNYKLGLIAPMNGYNIAGRSYTSTYPGRYDIEGDEASKWGYNFAEQFNYALSVDPQVILVTGWNEYQAGRHAFWPEGYASGIENAFPDQFNDEFSRDIEPTKGDLADHYYYQLVNFSRQYQGARPIPTPSESATIDIYGGTEQWQNVAPYYASYIGNTEDRDADGYGNAHYTETSGRNDIIGSQIARDAEYIYFLVECADNITPATDSLWMNLYIDSNQENQGWNTFEYMIHKVDLTSSSLTLQKFNADDSYSTQKVADVEYNLDGRYMTVKIKKADLGIEGDDYTINFAWTDNVHDEGDYSKFSGDIMDFYISGDVAPGGRFKYSYISTAENTGEHQNPTPDTPDDPEISTDGGSSSEQTTEEILTSEPTSAETDTAGDVTTENNESEMMTEKTTEEISASIPEESTANEQALPPTEKKKGCKATVSVFVPMAMLPLALAIRKKKRFDIN